MNFKDLSRFKSKFKVRRYTRMSTCCWIWTGTISESRRGGQYGRFYLDGKNQRAHRAAYEHYIGPIPEGYTLDHLCKKTLCVNPYHLEAVTNIENIMRSNGRCAAAMRRKAGKE